MAVTKYLQFAASGSCGAVTRRPMGVQGSSGRDFTVQTGYTGVSFNYVPGAITFEAGTWQARAWLRTSFGGPSTVWVRLRRTNSGCVTQETIFETSVSVPGSAPAEYVFSQAKGAITFSAGDYLILEVKKVGAWVTYFRYNGTTQANSRVIHPDELVLDEGKVYALDVDVDYTEVEGKVYTLDMDVEYQGIMIPAASTAAGIVPNETLGSSNPYMIATDSPAHEGIDEGISGYDNTDHIKTDPVIAPFHDIQNAAFGFTNPALGGGIVAAIRMSIAVKNDDAGDGMQVVSARIKVDGIYLDWKELQWAGLGESVVMLTWPGVAYNEAQMATLQIELEVDYTASVTWDNVWFYAVEASVLFQATDGAGAVKGLKFRRELGPLQFKQKTLSFRSKRLEHGLRFRGTSIFPKED